MLPPGIARRAASSRFFAAGRVFLGGLLFSLTVLGGLFRGVAQAISTPPSAPTSASTEFVDRVGDQFRLEAQIAFRNAESERLLAVAAAKPLTLKLLETLSNSPAQDALVEILRGSDEGMVSALKKAAAEVSAPEADLLNQWRAVRAALTRDRRKHFELDTQQYAVGNLVFLLGADNRWFWLFGLLACSALVAVVCHEHRHDLRRQFNGGRARSMGLARILSALLLLLALATCGAFFFADQIAERLIGKPPARESNENNESLEKSLALLRQDLQKAELRYNAVSQQWTVAAEKSVPNNAKMVRNWLDVREEIAKIAVTLAVQGGIGKRLESDANSLKEVSDRLASQQSQITACYQRRRLISGGLGLGLIGMIAIGSIVFQRVTRRRREKVHNTCPLCLGEGTFEITTDGLSRDGEGTQMMRCKNQVSQEPYQECDFTFLSKYLEMPKLCFPTLGIPASGKTHWLAMSYRELTRGNYPKIVQFAKVRSPEAVKFDEIVDEILNKRISTAATQTDRIPCPLVFNFLDHDRLGRSSLLVNIFDYSGEVVRSQTLEDHQRRRALDGDGFLFFLDPTLPSESQAQALANFSEDLYAIKGVSIGKQLAIPVALCMSKIDLMVNQPYADLGGEGAIASFYRDLGEVGWDLNLPGIKARSDLVARLRDTVWPGWQVQRQIHELFGGRYMFFPLTPVGLDGVGESDLSRRTIAPLGLLEPLLWLLHMNGFPVFL